MDLVEAAVDAHLLVPVLGGGAVVPEPTEALGDRRVGGGHGARVPEGTEVLGRIEPPCRSAAERPDRTAAVSGPVGLGRVLDDAQAVPSTDVQDRVHVGGPA